MPTFLTSNLRRAYFRSWEHFNLGLHLDVEGIAEKVIERLCWGGESIVNKSANLVKVSYIGHRQSYQVSCIELS